MHNTNKQIIIGLLFVLISMNIMGEVSGISAGFIFNTEKGCNMNYYDFGISPGEFFHIGSIKLESDLLSFGYPDSFYDFFKEDNLFRSGKEYLEFFDMNSTEHSGRITLRFENKSEPRSRIMPGIYPITIISEFQRRDDSYIPIDPLYSSITIRTFVDVMNISLIGRHNEKNRAVMGENLTVILDGIKAGVYTSSLNVNVKYHDRYFRMQKLIANNDENQVFPEFIDTTTYDLNENIVCPRENLTIEFTELCAENKIQIEQVIPEPSDIYYKVNTFFDNKNVQMINQIYYMVGAYFNCRREDVKSFL